MATTKSIQRFELSEEDVRVAIAQFIERTFGESGAKITVVLSVETVTKGFGTAEHDEHQVSVTASREI